MKRAFYLFTVGGTAGSAAPLVAVAKELRRRSPEARVQFLSTFGGPATRLVREAGLPLRRFPAGKWRRYFSLWNVIDAATVAVSFFAALVLLLVRRPSLVVTAGSFLSVPVVWAARLLGVPVALHQQDARRGFANALMAPAAAAVTAVFDVSVQDFSKPVTVTGNPVRSEVRGGDAGRGRELWKTPGGLPMLLVVGGSSGAEFFNTLVAATRERLSGVCQIVHIAGGSGEERTERYVRVPFLGKEFGDTLAAADIVVTRAGLNALLEIAAARKAAIVVPMPDSHQDDNADVFERAGAALVMRQSSLSPETFVAAVERLFSRPDERERLRDHAARFDRPDAAAQLADLYERLAQ